jgi:hypothetical protein
MKNTWPDGAYEGGFKNGKFHGQGTYSFNEGRKVEGINKNGQPWNAIMYDKKGIVIKEYFEGKIKQ